MRRYRMSPSRVSALQESGIAGSLGKDVPVDGPPALLEEPSGPESVFQKIARSHVPDRPATAVCGLPRRSVPKLH